MSGPTSPEQICNQALARIGHEKRIADLTEGSKAARVALEIYGQTRDELLRRQDWGFAERNITLALLKSAPVGGYIPPTVWSSAYPPLPWAFEYAYPGDCLKVRAVKSVPLFIPNFDPQPNVFDIANDNSLATQAKVILTNVASAALIYTGQIVDMTVWEPTFVEGLVAALGRRLAPALAKLDQGGAAETKMEGADEQVSVALADMRQG